MTSRTCLLIICLDIVDISLHCTTSICFTTIHRSFNTFKNRRISIDTRVCLLITFVEIVEKTVN